MSKLLDFAVVFTMVSIVFVAGINFDIGWFITTDYYDDPTAPWSHINTSYIHVYDNQVVIDGEFGWASFTDTNSMQPVFTAGHNVLQKLVNSTEQVHVGDIISYKNEDGKINLIIHRVIKIAYDDEGWYAIVKGDNNKRADPDRVRIENIKRITVAVIY